MRDNMAIPRMIIFLFLMNAFLIPQAHADDADSQAPSSGLHHWSFDDKKSTPSPYGENINGQSYNQDGAISGAPASSTSSSFGEDINGQPYHYNPDGTVAVPSPSQTSSASSSFGEDINGHKYNQDGTVSAS